MKRSALLLIACLLLASVSFAQQNPADAPASKADIEKYLDVLHTRDLMKTMLDAMSKQMHQMIAEQLKKDPAMTPEMQARANKMMDDIIKSMPIDDLIDAMIPVYQKHFTKGNIDDLLAFYSTPTGQKLVKELPAITTEAMQAVMPISQRMMATAMQRGKDELAQMQKENDASSKKQTQQN
jgi:uncharacterized protein